MPNQRAAGLARVHFYTEAALKAEFVSATVRNGDTITGALEQAMADYIAASNSENTPEAQLAQDRN